MDTIGAFISSAFNYTINLESLCLFIPCYVCSIYFFLNCNTLLWTKFSIIKTIKGTFKTDFNLAIHKKHTHKNIAALNVKIQILGYQIDGLKFDKQINGVVKFFPSSSPGQS